MISFSRKWKALKNYWTRTLRNLRTSRSPSWPFLFPSVEFCEICYSCNFCHICCSVFSHSIAFAIFAKFADIAKPFLTSSVSKSWFLLDFLFLRYLSRVFLASKKNPCYFCDFRDICGHFGVLLGFFCFQVLILFRFVIFAIFAIFVTGVFS